MGDKPPIQLLVRPQFDDASYYEVCWVNEVPAWAGSGGRLVSEIPEDCLDLAPFMAARALLKSAYDLTRLSIVRLYGADYEMLRVRRSARPPRHRSSTLQHQSQGQRVALSIWI